MAGRQFSGGLNLIDLFGNGLNGNTLRAYAPVSASSVRRFLLLPTLGGAVRLRRLPGPVAAARWLGPTTSDRTPLPGVNFIVKGTSDGTSTNVDGRYALTGVPAGATLVFSFVGYEPMERRADGGPLDITLVASRRDRVTAEQEVTSKDIIDSRQTNIVNALQGKVAGVNITSSGGGVGSSLVIRGGTLLDGNNQPLFVMTG